MSIDPFILMYYVLNVFVASMRIIIRIWKIYENDYLLMA